MALKKIDNLYSKLLDRRLSQVTNVNNQVMLNNKKFKKKIDYLKEEFPSARNKLKKMESQLDSGSLMEPIPSLRLMTFIKEELNSYLFTDRQLLLSDPVYRIPEVKTLFKGSKFEIIKRKRETLMEDVSFDERLTSGTYIAPILILKLVHDTKIKQLFFDDLYGGKIINSIKDISETKDRVYFGSKGQFANNVNGKVMFENYIPKTINIEHINRYDHSLSDEDEEILKRKIETGNLLNEKDRKDNDLRKEQLSEIVSKENILDTTIYIELYQELLLNIDKRFKDLKNSGEDIFLNNEVKVLTSLFKRNSLLLDACNTLLSKDYDFVPEMYVLLGKIVSETDYPFFNNFLNRNEKEKVVAINNLMRNIKKIPSSMKNQIDFNEYQFLIYNYKQGQEKDPYQVSFMKENKDALDFVMFIEEEIDRLMKVSGGWQNYFIKNGTENIKPRVGIEKEKLDINEFFKNQYKESFVVKLPQLNKLNTEGKYVEDLLGQGILQNMNDEDFEIKEKVEITLNISKYFNKQMFLDNTNSIELIVGAQNDLLSLLFERNNKEVQIETNRLLYTSYGDNEKEENKNRNKGNLENGEIKFVFSENDCNKDFIKYVMKKIVLLTFDYLENNLLSMQDEVNSTYSRMELQMFNKNELLLHTCLNEMVGGFSHTNLKEFYEQLEKEWREISLHGVLKNIDKKEVNNHRRKI